MGFARRTFGKFLANAMDKPQSVLVVDDNESLNRVITELLRAKGFEVWNAYNGVQGYTCYLGHATQFVVTDIQMPELNGIEMMRCIRAINPAVKTIYASGAGEQFRTALAMEEQDFGAIFLNKPFSGKDLIRVMSDGLNDSIRDIANSK